jgi:hypothetical protein
VIALEVPLDHREFENLEDGGVNLASDDPGPILQLTPKRTRGEMVTRRLRFVLPQARALPRGLVTNISALGGVGKTRFVAQWLAEMAEGLPAFGEDTFRPDEKVRGLYIGAEDAEPLFNEIALPLLASDSATLPFDVLLLEEQSAPFALGEAGARLLAAFAKANGPYDVIALDPLAALVPVEFGEVAKNNFIARQWQRIAFRPLLTACPDAAIILAAHDTKLGVAMSGPGDLTNFGRSGLQLRAGGTDGCPDDVPKGSIELKRFKDNVGFRWERMILRRDPDTLLLTVTSTEAAYGAGARRSAWSAAEAEQYLATQALRFLRPSPVPDSERIRARVEATLASNAARDGVKVSTRAIVRFLDALCTWRSERMGRSDVRILASVTDPSEAERARYGD